MNKRDLQTYSVWAKDNLEKQIEISLKLLGINGDQDFKNAKRAGDYTIIDGDPNSYPADLLGKRSRIIELVKEKGYQNIIEEFAYTWFNRFVALRFMEVHDFLPHGFRVLSNRSGGIEPEILKNLNLVRDELRLDMAVCASLKEQGKTEELYRYVLLRQCNALADILPMLFAKDGDYLELLLPKSLLIGETVITRLIEIPEDNFLNDVEAIGWLYQFYVADKRQQYRDAKTVTKELIPTLTQVFTTDWIVRYMAENSLGRLWMESYPQSSLRADMKYYVDDPVQTEEVQRKLDAIKYKNVNPEDIRVIEPCCGSGHILAIAFDLLYKMYEEKGYSKRDIPTLILSKNLYGLEIDKRAAQLANFSLVMKARSINPRFFNNTYFVSPQVYEIYDSTPLESLSYRTRMTETQTFSADEIKEVGALVDLFRNGKTVGSLIKVKPLKWELIESVIYKLENEVVTSVFNIDFVTEGAVLLKNLLAQAKVMSVKYDVMITNPPYLGISNMEATPKEYLTANYPDSKSDMFAMFMEAPFVKRGGFRAMVNSDSWMSLISYKALRYKIYNSNDLISLIQLGLGAFDATIQTTAFVLRNSCFHPSSVFYRLVDSSDKEADFLTGSPYVRNCSDFEVIPGFPVTAYWASQNLLDLYNKPLIGSRYEAKEGVGTRNDDVFLKLFWEVSYNKIGKGKRWIFTDKAGGYKKWFLGLSYVMDWENNGSRIKNYRDENGKLRSRPQNTQYLFRSGVSWGKIGTGASSFRYRPEGFGFNDAAPTLFGRNQLPLLAALNTNIYKKLLRVRGETLNMTCGVISELPLLGYDDIVLQQTLSELVRENIVISHGEWCSFETSYEFKYHPLLALKSSKEWGAVLIKDKYDNWDRETREQFQFLRKNEEEINRIFIDYYDLNSELTPEIDNSEISLQIADKERDIKSLISYLVGIIMGRYSLDIDGLSYAGGDWDASKYITYQPDDDGIIPIYSKVGMEDGLTARIIELIKMIYGEDTYRQNIDFIAEALGKGNNESSEETLNRYLNDGFYADHLKIYQKRPIYWMFSSGKHSGFKCLIYMHRYTEDTLARINGKYFLPESTRLKNDLEELLSRINSAEGRERIRLEKERQKLSAAYTEAIEYGQVLDHMANKYIAIDLDDGVKVNYAKFQGAELVTDSGTKVKKDLLVPIK